MAVSRPFVYLTLNGQAIGFYNACLHRCLNAVVTANDPVTIYQTLLTADPPNQLLRILGGLYKGPHMNTLIRHYRRCTSAPDTYAARKVIRSARPDRMLD